MKQIMRRYLKKLITKAIGSIFGRSSNLYKVVQNDEQDELYISAIVFNNSSQDIQTKLYPPYRVNNSDVGNYTYISHNAKIQNTTIGKFCSIGPNLISGWGVHPTNGISTHPMFYSTLKQNGITLSKENKIEEIKRITIGNDVFIGMNVIILDGVNIGDGAVIGAGSVVSKDIPPYAIAVGCPIEIKSYRFDEDTIGKLAETKWWDFSLDELKEVEADFFNVESFISKK
jgi:acetyltransferase-like isoleucine patch superfamily enzyme